MTDRDVGETGGDSDGDVGNSGGDSDRDSVTSVLSENGVCI